MKEEIGSRLRAARERQHMTLADVANKMGIAGKGGASRLSNYENGIREPDANTMMRIAAALGEDPADLMFGESSSATDSATDLEGLTPGTRKLILALSRADRIGAMEKDAVDALWAVLALYLRLKQALDNRGSDELLERLKNS